jgi:hypothetical protein
MRQMSESRDASNLETTFALVLWLDRFELSRFGNAQL